MIPQAGSAYAYTYATLGELVAWIIGWDLILEYAVGNVAVAIAEQIVAVYDEASEILRVEPRRLIFPFPRLPRSSLEDRPGGF